METPSFQTIRATKCYAPELAFANEDYPREAFWKLAGIEDRHFWFRSRNNVIAILIARFLGGRTSSADFLEIGCGTGYVLRRLAAVPYLRVMGAEIHLAGIELAKQRVPDVEIVQLDATRLPFTGRFDAIGMFDVLEHIERDEEVMRSVHQALGPGGLFFITVPQHPFLWSRQDDLAHHQRRYTRRELLGKLGDCGFQIEYAGSFCFTLFPLMAAARLFKRRGAGSISEELEGSEFSPPPVVNGLLRALLRVDEWFIRRGVGLPWGGSLVAVARKAETPLPR
jgi:SAM-dependent methyltransferase